MKSRLFVAFISVVCVLAVLAGCKSNKPAEQPQKQQDAATQPPAQPAEDEDASTQPRSPFSGPPPVEEMPPMVTPEKPAELPPLEVKPVQPNDLSADAVKAAFDKMKLGNSPTFGALYRDWVMALYARDFDKAWAMYGTITQDNIGLQSEVDVRSLNLTIRMQEMALQQAKMTPQQEENTRNYIALLSEKLGKVRMMPNRKYHAYVFQEKERVTGKNPAEQFLTEGLEVKGESIKNDKKGCIWTNLPAPLDRLFFVKENGAWKIRFTRIPRVPIDQPPSAPEPPKQ